MRRLILASLVLALASPAFADPRDHHDRRGPPGHARHQDDHDLRDRHDDRRWSREDDRRHHDRDYLRNGYRLSRDELRHLPRLPPGQEYRRRGNDLFTVDSDTLKIVAVLGLLSAFMAMR